MSVIARIALISAFLVLMVGCSHTPTEVPDCVNTGDSTMIGCSNTPTEVPSCENVGDSTIVGCNNMPIEVIDCVNTSDSTMVCGDTQFTIY